MSAPGVPLQVLAIAGLEMVAEANVPAVLTQVVDEVSNVPPEHASLDGGDGIGGSVIQRSKVPDELLLEKTLT